MKNLFAVLFVFCVSSGQSAFASNEVVAFTGAIAGDLLIQVHANEANGQKTLILDQNSGFSFSCDQSKCSFQNSPVLINSEAYTYGGSATIMTFSGDTAQTFFENVGNWTSETGYTQPVYSLGFDGSTIDMLYYPNNQELWIGNEQGRVDCDNAGG